MTSSYAMFGTEKAHLTAPTTQAEDQPLAEAGNCLESV